MTRPSIRIFCCLLCLLGCSAQWSLGQQDTDGDGLLDLEDEVVDPSQFTGRAFIVSGIQDLDGASQFVNVRSLFLCCLFTSIENGDFQGVTNLQSLSLGFQVENIEPGAFNGLTNLQTLSLAGNPITNIEPGAFDGLTNLQSLSLADNPITNIEPGTFDGLTNLQTLSLSSIQIASIASVDFRSLTNLQTLGLAGNQITTIERGAFRRLTHLEWLGLYENHITSIERGAFEGLTNLEWLGLYGNQITSIESGAFEGLANLNWLTLDGNPIMKIDSGAFHGLAELSTLRLPGNQLTELNLTRSTFNSLLPCTPLPGFCVDNADETIASLILDGAKLSVGSFKAIVSETTSITDVSLDGLTFNDENPSDLSQLLGIGSLVNVTVDPNLYDLYAAEFDAFGAIEGNTVTVVTPDCNGDGVISMQDANCTSDWKLDRFMDDYGSLRGDLDGLGGVDFADFLTLSDNFGNSSAAYTDGDFDKDGSVGFADFLLLSANFGQGGDFSGGVVAQAVPEPPTFPLCGIACLAGLAVLRRHRYIVPCHRLQTK